MIATSRFAGAPETWKEASRSFLRFSPTVLIGIAPTRVMTMTTYGATQRHLAERYKWMLPEENKFISSLAAGIALSIASASAELFKTQQQLAQQKMSISRMDLTGQFPVKSLYNTFLPLSMRATSSALFLLVGTEYIQ